MPDEPQNQTVVATGPTAAVAGAVKETIKEGLKAEPFKVVLLFLGMMMAAWIGMMIAGGFVFLRLLESERNASTRIIQEESEKNRTSQVEAAKILAEAQKMRDQSIESQAKLYTTSLTALNSSVGVQNERLMLLMSKLETALDRLNRKLPEPDIEPINRP